MFDLAVTLVIADLFNIGGMTMEVMFGLKIVVLVMVYGYMHRNLGGGILSTSVFLIFAYYFLFVAQGVLAIVVLLIFFLMIHGFDILWGGDIVKGNIGEIRAARGAGGEMMQGGPFRPHVPP